MKRVLSLLLVIFILAGCANDVVAPTEAPRPDLLDQKQPLDDLYCLYDTGILMPEGHMEPNLYGIGEDLLLLSISYADIETCQLLLHRIDTYSGQVVAEATIPSEGFATVQVFGDTVCLSSAPSGKIWVLDGQLKVQREYSFSANYYDWFVTRDLKTLYQLGWDTGLYSYDLATGTQTQILSGESAVSYRTRSEERVLFTYVDPETQMTCTGLLDLGEGQLSRLDIAGDINDYASVPDVWLATPWDRQESYLLGGANRETQQFRTEESFCSLTSQGDIVTRNYATGRVAMYDSEGKMVGQTQLPMGEYGANGYLSDDMIWDGARGGYFLLYTTFDDPEGVDHPEAEPEYESVLAFWKLQQPSQTDCLPYQPYTDEQTPVGTATDQIVFDRAKALGERFGVTVLVADQCLTSYDSFLAELATDADQVNWALTELERALRVYPEGFLQQLQYGTITKLEFSIVGALEPLREEEYGSTIAAFAQPLDGKYIIVADANIVTDTTFHHELCHVIDRRLDWDASHSAGALYSEETWASMNPKGFTYDMTYALHNNRWDYNEKYFVSSYSCTYPTEDRATMWEQSMVGNYYPFQSAPLREKLEYYSDCIRDCFDTTGWPTILPWEEVLQ